MATVDFVVNENKLITTNNIRLKRKAIANGKTFRYGGCIGTLFIHRLS